MSKSSSLLRRFAVLMMALAIVCAYSVVPMGQSFAATAKKPAKVTGVKAKALSTTSIKISWSKAKNAKKYQVYRATKKSGKYSKVATTKSKSYTNKKLKSGKKYYYKVRAVNGKKTGKFSKIVYATTKKKSPEPEPEPEPDFEVKSDPVTVKKMTTVIDMTDSKYDGKEVRVWVPVPQTNDEQTVWGEDYDAENLSAAKAEFTTESKYGNKMLYLEWAADAKAADRKATLTYNVRRVEVANRNLVEDDAAGIPEDVKPYITEESEYVKVNAEIVKSTAAAITEGKTGTLEKARAIYDWCIGNLERIDNGEVLEGTDGKTHEFKIVGCGYGDTVKILTDQKEFGRAGGHCTDINSTFVALCRAAGIPAREMFGIRLSASATGGQHCWAQFYLPGTGWVYADPGDVLKFGVKDNKSMLNMTLAELKAARATKKTKAYTEYYWGAVDSNRVKLSDGRDVILEPAQSPQNGAYNTFGYPSGEANGERIECTDAANFSYTITCDEMPVTITAAELSLTGAIQDGTKSGYKILDVRREASYKESHIPGAVSADVDGAVQGTDDAAAKANVEKAVAGDPEDMKYVLICYTGNKYANAARDILLDLGKKNANIFILAQDDGIQGNGGMKAYKGALVNPEAQTVTVKAYMNGNIKMGSHLPDVTHHVVVNKNGSNAPAATMTTDALVGELYRGLLELGAVPGENFDGTKPPAGSMVHGDLIDVKFDWEGGSAGMSDLYKSVIKENTDGTVETADFKTSMVYGGNIAYNSKYAGDANNTGCLTCTFSCFIGTVSNGAYGYSTNEAYVNRDVAPAAGTEILVTYSIAKNKVISPEDLMGMMSDKNLKILDVRHMDRTDTSKTAYDAGHIPGAVSADVEGAVAETNPDEAKANVEKAIKGCTGDTVFVLACYSGNKYANAGYKILQDLGVSRDRILILGQDDRTQGPNGGMAGWTAKYPKEVISAADIAAVKQNTVYVTPQWLKEAMSGNIAGYEDLVVGAVAYADGAKGKYEAGHIPGAVFVTSVEVEDGAGTVEEPYNLLKPEVVRDNLLGHGITKDTKVVLYDMGGDPSEVGRQAYGYLWCGVEDVKILDGHMAVWNYGTETKENAPEAATSFGTNVPAHPEYWTSMADAKAKLASDPDFKLVSIRAEAEFLGKTSGYNYIPKAGEPEGAVWGRGSTASDNVSEFINEDGTVKDLDGFKEVWKDCNFKTDDSQHLSFYCGTGWRATVPFLVLYENGYKNISVYDGGWYEWQMHDENPAQVGDPASPDCVHTTVGELPSSN